MKYRLVTLLFILTIGALVAGLVRFRADANNAIARTEREFDKIRGGVRKEAEVRQLIYLSRIGELASLDKNRKSELHYLLVFAMWELHCYENQIDLAYPGEDHAIKHGGAILTALQCRTANDFFSLARDLYNDPENWPEYYDLDENGYIDYFDFVQRCCKQIDGG